VLSLLLTIIPLVCSQQTLIPEILHFPKSLESVSEWVILNIKGGRIWLVLFKRIIPLKGGPVYNTKEIGID
jgi:hypothetical protein